MGTWSLTHPLLLGHTVGCGGDEEEAGDGYQDEKWESRVDGAGGAGTGVG